MRPIAFKPVIGAKPLSQQQSFSPDNTYYEKSQIDDGYASQDSRTCSHNGTMRDSYNTYDSFDSSQCRETRQVECYQATPSPSDSGVSDLELILRDKERELITLRETMEANERIIFQVNEEKRINWETQMKELTAEYHRRLRVQQDRSLKMEHDMQDVVNSLQKDNQKLLTEKEQLLIQRDRNSHLQTQVKHLKQQNEDLSLQIQKLNKDCEELRCDNKQKDNMIMSLEEQITVVKADNMNLSNELDERRRIAKRQERHDASGDSQEIARLERLLAERDSQISAEREKFNTERDIWEQEKKKVLQYQKQLQANYMQMCRRNSELEAMSASSPPSNRSHNVNNNDYMSKKPDSSRSFKAQLESKPESLC